MFRLSCSELYMPQVPKAGLYRAWVSDQKRILQGCPHLFSHFLRWPGSLGNVVSPDLASRAGWCLRRPLTRLFTALLKCEFHPYRLCRHRHKIACCGIQIAALPNTHSAKPLCLLSLLGRKLLELAGEIANIFAITFTRYDRRLLDRVKIESQPNRLALK